MPGCRSKDDATCIALNNITHKISRNIISASSTHTRREAVNRRSLRVHQMKKSILAVTLSPLEDMTEKLVFVLHWYLPPRSRRDFPFTHWCCRGTTCLMSIAAFEWLLVNAPPTVTEGATSPNPPRHWPVREHMMRSNVPFHPKGNPR